MFQKRIANSQTSTFRLQIRKSRLQGQSCTSGGNPKCINQNTLIQVANFPRILCQVRRIILGETARISIP